MLCLDGTWNNAHNVRKRDDGHKVLKPTNVLKLARSVLPCDHSGRDQITYYDVGIGATASYKGASNRLLTTGDRWLGGAWGAGFEANVERALTFLVQNYERHDEVFILGFSRGAATAQAVTRFLDWAGGLPVKSDSYYLPRLLQKYIDSEGHESSSDAVAAINKERQEERDRERKTDPTKKKPKPVPPLKQFQAIDVKMLGLWDTVLALGSRMRAIGARTTMKSRTFHVSDQPAMCVKNARQALAIDEARFDFRPEYWKASYPHQKLEQRWFAGVHSNIGGGYAQDGLANIAFRWIVDEAAALDLAFDYGFVKFYNPFPQDRLYTSGPSVVRLIDAVPGRRGKGQRSIIEPGASANLKLDINVFHRMNSEPEKFSRLDLYRPANVIEYLACQPDLTAYLASYGITTLPSDVMARISAAKRLKLPARIVRLTRQTLNAARTWFRRR